MARTLVRLQRSTATTGVHEEDENRASQACCVKTYTASRQCTLTHGLPLAHLNIRRAGLVKRFRDSSSPSLPSSLSCCPSRIPATQPSPSPRHHLPLIRICSARVHSHSAVAPGPRGGKQFEAAPDLTATAFVSSPTPFTLRALA